MPLRSIVPGFIAAAAVLLVSCASGRDVVPVGGPADSTAPHIVSTVPANGATNVGEPEVRIEFDEWLQEQGIGDLVIITPIPAQLPEYDWSGRALVISLPGGLAPDRTYAVTLGAGVRDLAGNRLGAPFTLRFSTGPTIDSGVIQGTVAGVGRRRAYVFAWRLPDDAAGFTDTLRPELTRPDFIAPVGDNGAYSFETLPPGRFLLAAVTDEYGDQLITNGIDAVSVMGEPVTIRTNGERIQARAMRLPAAPADVSAPLLYSARSLSPSMTEVRFSEPIDTTALRRERFAITAGTVTASIDEVWRSSINRLAVMIAHSALPAGSEGTVIARDLVDTAGNRLPDTGATATFAVAIERDTTPPVLQPIGVDSVRAYQWPDTLTLTFDEAVRLTGGGAGVVQIRDTSASRLRFTLTRVNAATYRAAPVDSLPGFSRGTLDIDHRRFSDLAGNSGDTLQRIPVALAPLRQTGALGGTLSDSIAPDAPHVIIVEPARGGRQFRVAVRSGAWELAEVPEGEYRISAFRDENGNGVYDYGTLSPLRGAEPIIEWPSPVRVRPRWTTARVDLVFGR